MMNLEDARKLGLYLFELGLTPWIAETGDGYIVQVLIEGEIVNVIRSDVSGVGNN